MKILIVAKTRRGKGACVGGITETGQSVRLMPIDPTNERAGLEYNVGEVWEIESVPEPGIVAPHVENIVVNEARKLRVSKRLRETILRFMPPVAGGPEKLFDGLVRSTSTGALYVADSSGLPKRSTMFWVPDKALRLDCDGKRIRYRYPGEAGGSSLTFVGFQEPLPEIPAGTLLRVSLAHRWRPREKPEEELRCFVQLSGWLMEANSDRVGPPAEQSGNGVGVEPLEDPEPCSHSQRALDEMKRVFGFSQFLPLQREVITRVLRGEDGLVVMPTGAGKSLCYQLPALLLEGLTVVISPLIALMQDQVRQLRQVDVPTACLNHTIPYSEYSSIMRQARDGELKLLYVAPETLLRPEMLLLLEQSKLSCLAIDEAHCISEWGHDFRPEYRQLRTVRARVPGAACLALTATATERVRADIRRQLSIPVEGEFTASFNRKNLFLEVGPRKDALAQILAFLSHRRDQSGIIYSGTRKKADEICAALNANGWSALPYHAGLSSEERSRNQEQFIRDEVPLIVATIAFGMGINKPNVRFVIHAHLPKDMESYYQEIGRAGRDGMPAECLLLYSRGDAVVHRSFIDKGAAAERPGRQARLSAMIRFAETRQCRRAPLLSYFDEVPGEPCGTCDNCVRVSEPLETRDVTNDAVKFLTCVKATGERFGAAHIVSVLRGSRSERILSRRHERLSCYGTGQDHTTAEWQELARQFIEVGVVEQDLEFGGLKLTAKGREVLGGSQPVSVAVLHHPAEPKAHASLGEHDPQVFEALRALRREIAIEEGVPAYFIFSDRALMEMASVLPQNEAEFLSINGVGEAKLKRYSKRFLNAIPPSRGGITRAAPATSTPIVRPESGRRFREIGSAFAAGEPLGSIAQRFNIKPETVIENLYRYAQAGESLNPERLLAYSKLSDQERQRARQCFERLGMDRLGPVYRELSGGISYEELHLLRLYLLCAAPQQR